MDNISYLTDLRGNEVDFVVRLNDNEVLYVESKYNNLKDAIVNSLNKLFFKEINVKKVVQRIVVTNGINDSITRGMVKFDLVGLDRFLTRTI